MEGGRYFFNAVREGDSILYASDDENECHLWVMAMYRATGQSHKPTPPLTLQDKNSTISKIQGGKCDNSILCDTGTFPALRNCYSHSFDGVVVDNRDSAFLHFSANI